MNQALKFYGIALVVLLSVAKAWSQDIQISDNLHVHQLTASCYEHSQQGNNGLVFIQDGEAVIVSTPDSDTETQRLIDWVQEKKQAKIVAYVIDRWHPDAMQGLDVVQRNGIKSYAYERTREIAKERELPVPDQGFDPIKEIKVGRQKVVCHFLGEAHTPDGIVVWVPSEQVLFGGNEIRNYKGWVGNIGDARLASWSETATRIKQEYGSAKIVVPGHGQVGGPELIDYTIELFQVTQKDSTTSPAQSELRPNRNLPNELTVKAESEESDTEKRILQNARVVVQDPTKVIEIESPQVTIAARDSRIKSETGRVRIYDKTASGELLRTDVNYRQLIAYKSPTGKVGFVVILKAIEKNNR